jgi:hypothetical protein
VGVLNAGNSDDVIRDFATLEWQTEEPPAKEETMDEQKTGGHWKRVILYACKFTLLKGHSFQQIRFIVDRNGSENEWLEWEQCVKRGKPIIYRIILHAEKGSLSSQGTLFKSTRTPHRAIVARPTRDCED